MSEIRSKVGPDGQLVIPEEMTNVLDWIPGAEITFSIENGALVARKSQPRLIPFFYALAMKNLEELRAQREKNQ